MPARDNVPEVKIYVKIQGNFKSKKPPIVFMHGTAESNDSWACQQRAFGKKFMTIALDFRGSGRSTQTSPAIVKYTTQLFADDLHAVLQKLGINKFIYVGHSIGANTGLVYVNKYPQQVTKLVLVSGDSYLVTSNCSILPDCSTSNCSACWAYPLAMFSQIAALEEQIAQLGFEDFCKNDN